MKKSFKDRINDLNLSYKKEVTLLAIINLLIIVGGAIGYYFLKEFIIALLAIVVLLVANYLYLSRYSTLEKRVEKNRVDELISLLSYFEMFISNGNNVYSSFKQLIPYSSLFMENAINDLLSQIDADKSVGPYIEFASKFSNRIIESLMLSIYQMVDNGQNGEQFQEFNFLFSVVEKDHQVNKIEEKQRSISFLDSFPLFGAGAITIILAMSILSIVGDLIDVI